MFVACGEPGSSDPAGDGRIDRLAPAFDELIAPDAEIERIADGFEFTEGPVWVADGDGGHLLFSDIPANAIYRWSESEGSTAFLSPVTPDDSDAGGAGGSNGLLLDAEGRLVLFEHGNRQVSRLERDGSRTVLADRYRGKRLNSPNDGVLHSSGAIYFTDPPYGLAEPGVGPGRELEWDGIYRLRPDGTLDLLTSEQPRPNGIALSPDERKLYVASSTGAPRRLWMAYPVLDDGTLGDGSVFFDATDSRERGAPDGIAVDERGNLWATGPGGILVLSSEGAHLGTIRLPELPANATFGEDGRTLFITAVSGVYRVRTRVRGR